MRDFSLNGQNESLKPVIKKIYPYLLGLNNYRPDNGGFYEISKVLKIIAEENKSRHQCRHKQQWL